MRCIEINFVFFAGADASGLIETWDVLKFKYATQTMGFNIRLIETWDVLKYNHGYFFQFCAAWLIETWDVLKF